MESILKTFDLKMEDVNGDEEVKNVHMKEIERLKKQVERMEVIELNARKSLEMNKEKTSSQLEDGQNKMEKNYKQVQDYIDKIIGRKKQDGSYGEYKDFICEATAETG